MPFIAWLAHVREVGVLIDPKALRMVRSTKCLAGLCSTSEHAAHKKPCIAILTGKGHVMPRRLRLPVILIEHAHTPPLQLCSSRIKH